MHNDQQKSLMATEIRNCKELTIQKQIFNQWPLASILKSHKGRASPEACLYETLD